MPITLPHAELIVPEDSIIQEFRGRYSETPYKGVDAKTAFEKGGYRSQEHPRATHAAMVTRIDMYVGEVVEKLKESGVFENTLIIFTSDNGPHREGGADPGFFNSNGIYRGYKRDLYEGAIRVPTIITWQGRVPSGSESNFPFAFWDYLPTFAGLTGQDAPAATDGIDILPALFGQEGEAERDYFYFEFHELGGRQAVIKGNWKLLRLDIRQEERYELYNIASDPSENHNLLKRYPDKATELREIMEEARIDDPHWPLF